MKTIVTPSSAWVPQTIFLQLKVLSQYPSEDPEQDKGGRRWMEFEDRDKDVVDGF